MGHRSRAPQSRAPASSSGGEAGPMCEAPNPSSMGNAATVQACGLGGDGPTSGGGPEPMMSGGDGPAMSGGGGDGGMCTAPPPSAGPVCAAEDQPNPSRAPAQPAQAGPSREQVESQSRRARDGNRLQGLIARATAPPGDRALLQRIADAIELCQQQAHIAADSRESRTLTVPENGVYELDDEQLRVFALEVQNGLRQHARLSVAQQDATSPQQQRAQQASRDLGRQRSMSGFCTGAGALVDGIVPSDGSEAGLRINANFPLVASGNVTAGLEFRIEAERDADKVKIRTQLGATITGRADLWLVEAWARAQVYGYIEAEGNNGAECVRMMMYAIRQRVAQASDRLANAMFDQRFVADTEAGMQGEDYVESGLGAEVSGGVGTPGGDAGVGARASGEGGTRIGRGDDGRMQGRQSRTVRVGVTIAEDPFELEGQLELKWLNGQFHEGEIELTGTAELDLEKLEHCVGPEFMGGMVGALAGTLTRQNGLVAGDANAARQIGGATDFILGCNAARLGGAAAVQALATRYPNVPIQELSAAYALTLKSKWDASGNAEFFMRLARQTQFQIGESERSPFYLELSSLTPLFVARLRGGTGAGANPAPPPAPPAQAAPRS